MEIIIYVNLTSDYKKKLGKCNSNTTSSHTTNNIINKLYTIWKDKSLNTEIVS